MILSASTLRNINQKKYVEKDTECDKCEYLKNCIEKGNYIDCTTSYDTRRHYECSRLYCLKRKELGWMKMTFDEKKAEIRKNIEELKEDIKILNKNISEFESVLDKVNSFDEMEQYKEMDIEKGLKHIELF